MTVSDERFNALVLGLYRGVREVSFAQFQDFALQLIKSALDFDAAIWGMGTSNGRGGFISSVHLHELPPRLMDDYAGEVQSQDLAAERTTSQPGRTMSIPLNDPEMATEGRATARAFLRKYGLAHLLSTASPDAALGLSHFLTLSRSNAAQPWSEASRQLKERLFPHVIEAYVQARYLHMERNNGMERGYAITDHTLLIVHIAPVFRTLMLREWPDWVDWRMPPEVCVAWSGSTRTHFKGKHVIINIEADQQLIHVTVRMRNALDVLTPRELTVARLFTRGLIHKEVAREIGVSPHTVRNQLKAIYLKLGVSNKLSLAACLDELV